MNAKTRNALERKANRLRAEIARLDRAIAETDRPMCGARGEGVIRISLRPIIPHVTCRDFERFSPPVRKAVTKMVRLAAKAAAEGKL